MDFFQRVFRNFETVVNCIRQGNSDLLSLQLPILTENFNLFSQIATNIHDASDSQSLSDLLELFHSQLEECENFLAESPTEVSPTTGSPNIHLSVLQEGRNGRPRINIPNPTIITLRNCGVSWTEISRILNVSRMTLWNALNSNRIQDPTAVQAISDDDLLALIAEVKYEHPAAGWRFVWSALKSRGVNVPRRRLQTSLRIIDPIGVLNRRRTRLKRRQYRVKAANYLWHMDANEKLVSWNMYIHGAVDGFSRKIIYLELSLTKLAEVLLEFFTRGVAQNGLPMRVRGDYGSENVGVIDFMNSRRSNVTNPVILGKSVHNTRVERMWCEVNRIVSSKFRGIFGFLEDNGVLSQLLLTDLLCLWYVYYPRIQRSLTHFKNTWNTHGLSTMKHRSPNHLWLCSLMVLDSQQDVLALELLPERLTIQSTPNCESFTNLLLKSNLQLDLDAVSYISGIFEQLVPDPMSDDGRDGINHYLTLRNHFLTE